MGTQLSTLNTQGPHCTADAILAHVQTLWLRSEPESAETGDATRDLEHIVLVQARHAAAFLCRDTDIVIDHAGVKAMRA